MLIYIILQAILPYFNLGDWIDWLFRFTFSVTIKPEIIILLVYSYLTTLFYGNGNWVSHHIISYVII